MIKIQRKFLKSVLTVLFVVFISMGLVGGCGTTAPEAPFGSTINFQIEPDEIQLCNIPSLYR